MRLQEQGITKCSSSHKLKIMWCSLKQCPSLLINILKKLFESMLLKKLLLQLYSQAKVDKDFFCHKFFFYLFICLFYFLCSCTINPFRSMKGKFSKYLPFCIFLFLYCIMIWANELVHLCKQQKLIRVKIDLRHEK